MISQRIWRLTLAALGLLHAWLAVSISDWQGTTADEIAHVASGHAYWTENDYRLQSENGQLPQRLAALPLVVSQAFTFPDLSPSAGPHTRAWKNADAWGLGGDFFFTTRNNPETILYLARAMIALFGGLTVWLIGDWSRRLFGTEAGLVSAALAAISPTLLAHAGLATSDTAGAAGFLLATAAWWRLCHLVTPGRIIAAGLALGMLALSKYSVLLFGPVAGILMLIRLSRASALPVCMPSLRLRLRNIGARATTLLAAGVVAALLGWLVIWAAYGFRYEARGPRSPVDATFSVAWPEVMIEQTRDVALYMADGQSQGKSVHLSPGIVQHAVALGRKWHLMPEAWLHGLAFVDRHSRYRPAFLSGEWEAGGWWWFFPFTFLLKSTPVELLLSVLVVAGLLTARSHSPRALRRRYQLAAPLCTLLIYGGFALSSSLNIGHRHILPMYGFGFVLAGFAVERLRRSVPRPFATAGIVLILAGQTFASFSIRPHYLSYFNLIGGGPDQGYLHLVDSSLDWGQNLPSLKIWLKQNAGGRPVFLSYFGADRPSHYGIQATRFGDTSFQPASTSLQSINYRPGIYVFSATMWQRVYTHVQGPWRRGYEEAYWAQVRFWLAPQPPSLDGATRETISPAERYERLLDYEHLRFGRLCHSLRNRRPDALIAHTFLVFNLSAGDIKDALSGPLEEDPAAAK